MAEPEVVKSLAEARPDLIHPFQCESGRESECSHWYSWLGGQVKCGAKESDTIHRNGPHLLTASNGEQAYCAGSPETCEACWQAARLDRLAADRQAQRRPRRLLREMSGAEFGEACADMAKAIERSRKQ
jgi:hypothetical protein